MCKTLLWLDDWRNPIDNPEWVKMFCPQAFFENWIILWAKNYNEFVDILESEGLPDYICFDHDLADESENEKTGYDCAKHLVDYCIIHQLSIPDFNVQSANPVGKERIIDFLTCWKKYYESKNS